MEEEEVDTRNELKRLLDRWEEIDQNNPNNAQLYGDENFEGPVKERKCTDVFYLAFFIFMNAGMLYVFYYALSEGDPARLSRGYDFRAEICGTGGLEDKKFMYWPDPHVLDFAMCVTDCPKYYLRDYMCLYDIDHQSILQDWDCWDTWECTYYGFYCLPVTEGERRSVLDFLFDPMTIARRSVGDVVLAWEAPFIGMLVSFTVGMLYLTIYRYPHFMHNLIVLSIVSSEVLLFFFVYLFIEDYYKNYSLMCEGPVLDPEFCEYNYFAYYLGFAGLALIVAIVYGVIMWRKRSKIRIGIQTIQLSCRPISTLKQLYIYPLIQLLVGGVLLIIAIMTVLYMLSTGQIVLVEDEEIPGGRSKVIEFSEYEKYMAGFSIIMSFWWLGFLSALGEFVLGAAISTWYFQKERSFLDSPLISGFKAIFRYHIGSVVKGSLFNTLCKLPRKSIAGIKKCLISCSKKCPWLTDCVAGSCCCCCISSYQNWLRFYLKYSYIILALFADKHSIASQKAYFLIKRHSNRITLPSEAGEFTMMIIKFTITLCGTAVAYSMVLLSDSTPSGQHTNELVGSIFITFFTLIVCSYISQIVAGTMQTCMNTVLMCGVCDEEMFVREQRYMDHELQVFLDQIHEEQTEMFREHKQKVRVNKANRIYDKQKVDSRKKSDAVNNLIRDTESEVNSARTLKHDPDSDDDAPIFVRRNNQPKGFN